MSQGNRRVLTTIALALLLVLAGCSGAGGDGAAPQDAGSEPLAADGTDNRASVGSFYANDSRVVVRNSRMVVETRAFDESFDRARQVAREHDGFVADWQTSNERGYQRATLRIRVPADRFNAARDALAALGTVERESVEMADFTRTYRDRAETLDRLEKRRADLRRSINETSDPETRRELREELAEVRQRIDELEAEQATLERRAALSTITLELREPPGEQPPKNYQAAFGFDDAFLDAFYGGLTVLKGVVVFFGYAIPVAFALVLLGAFVLAVVRLARRLYAALGLSLSPPGGGGGGSGGAAEPEPEPEAES